MYGFVMALYVVTKVGASYRAENSGRQSQQSGAGSFSPPYNLAAFLAVWQERRPSQASRAWH